MKPNKTISSFRKRLEQFIILLCINMLLSSCYTTHSVSEYTPKTIPGTTKIISFSHYEYEILNKGSNKNLYDINFYEVNNCQGKKNVGVIKRKKKISQKGWGWIYGPTAIITEIVGMWVGSNITNGSDGGMILGGILGAATICVPAILWHNKAPNYKDVNKLSTEAYKFKEKQILSNSSVKIE